MRGCSSADTDMNRETHDHHRNHHRHRDRRHHRCPGPAHPARQQNIPIWLTIVVGIVAALIGTFIARALGISTDTGGIDWLELLVQLVVAVIAVAFVVGVYSRQQCRARAPATDNTAAGGCSGRLQVLADGSIGDLLDAVAIFGNRSVCGWSLAGIRCRLLGCPGPR